MNAKVYVINEGDSSQYFGIMFFDGDSWQVSYPYKMYKTRAGAEKAIFKKGWTLVKE